ncbi:hypothetical protein [Bradyrhizobium sp. AZCC 2289]|uniref:hypothetical protein n=1 Tax=Bradyrhizobium sp. AZCC 2289 TaxID=3117026 RepID=UPI002FEFE13B
MLHPRLEIGGLFDQRCCHFRIRCCLGEFEKDGCLTLYVLPADHFSYPRLPTPHGYAEGRGIVPGQRYKVNIIFCSSADAAFFSGDPAPELEPGEGSDVESFASG